MRFCLWGQGISIESKSGFTVEVHTFSLSPELQRYFSALYCYKITAPDGAGASDCIYPDWAGLHFNAHGATSQVSIGDGPQHRCAAFAANGPTSRAMCLQTQNSQSWSLALNPLGWSRFADGPASEVANAMVDGSSHSTFARLAPILEIVRDGVGDDDGTARRIESFLCEIRQTRSNHEPQIAAMHDGLRDPAIGDVEALVERVGVSRRTLERLSARYFGFPPKLLLRRQRFVRSLGKFTIDPNRNWSASLDGHYVDQAHFVRDFRSFMGMTPSEYAQMPHPILEGIFTQRLAEQGAH
jgi:AraC-like DNA-binding protein